ncbi:hypothetical protein [Aestuariivirga litoralis]|uniref:hypothetical protein n=1 Tax=Aestuariivirga litoralis TaxID=2650924 RepID=UPI0018C76405|nr:hypothetical protein [Aestuariivirga litoralis]MBG1232984.1 hypothetical protein [Aestuariivirga litoralis]
MLSLSVSSNIAEVKRGMLRAEREVLPLATAKALTFAAEAGQKAIKASMTEVFDRPTAYTLNATYIKAATVGNPEAHVYLRQFGGKGVSADRYLLPEIDGGVRHQKSSERQLGPLMRGMRFAIPADLVPRDGYGNVPGRVFTQILSQLRVSSDAMQNQTAGSKRRGKAKGREEYFIPPPGSPLRAGVWKRMGRNVMPVLIFADHANYKRRLNFYGVGMAAARDAFPVKLEEQLSRELARVLPR